MRVKTKTVKCEMKRDVFTERAVNACGRKSSERNKGKRA
jgi:hypothetical protein